MAPRMSRLRYSELYGSRERQAQGQVAVGNAGRRERTMHLPFGYKLEGKSEARVRQRCIVMAILLVPALIWHFGIRPHAPLTTTGETAAEEVLTNKQMLERRLHEEGVTRHGYNCMDASDYRDHQEIAFRMVRKQHLTMGGTNSDGCASGEGPCLKNAWYLVVYIPSMFYMFIALAIICDEFFVPSLEMFVDHYGISMDIAGATFMAAGGSMPELFTSLISVFDESDVGFAAIVGSAVFNVLFVIAVCTLASSEPLELTAWPLGRDCAFYIIGLGLVAVFFKGSSPNEIEWWEALLLFGWYNCYCGFMVVNGRIKAWAESLRYRKAVAPETEEGKNSQEFGTGSGSVGKSMSLRSERSEKKSLRMPSQFRSGIVKLLTQHASLTETAGIAVVTELKGSLQEAFDEMDQDHDGKIDETEFNLFMQKLGWIPPSDDEIKNIKEDAASKLWKRMPLTADDKLTFTDFRKWYTVSEARIEVEVRRVFERLDQNGDGIVDQDEIKEMLACLGHRPSTNELEEVINQINRLAESADTEAGEEDAKASDHENRETKVCVRFEQFEKWYSQSLFCEQHKKNLQMEALEEEGFSIEWPEEDATWSQWFWYFFTYPLCAAMYCTLPDIRRPGMEGKVHWAIIEFLLSLLWIAVFSNAMYECMVVCSNTMGIPPPVAAVTILAAGTSVPDLLSSYIVARQGEGDMAVSSSIGSNIFDITVGLPIPWMLYSFINGGKAIRVNTQSLGFSVIVLMAMLVAVISTVVMMKWRMNRSLGAVMMLLYLVFITQDLLQQLPSTDPVFKVDF